MTTEQKNIIRHTIDEWLEPEGCCEISELAIFLRRYAIDRDTLDMYLAKEKTAGRLDLPIVGTRVFIVKP